MSHQGTQISCSADFSTFYLQQITQELSDDIQKVREAEDFKMDSVSFLVHALRQGSSQLLSKVEAMAAENQT